MVHVVGDDAFEMLVIQNEEPVETLRPNGSYEPLRYTIRLWCPKRSAHDLALLGPKHSSKLGVNF